MRISIYKVFSVAVSALMIIGLNNNALAWSWRDLKLGVTTEEELFEFGGWPLRVTFRTPQYFILKGGGKHPPEYVEYEDSEYIRSLVGDFGPFSHKGKVWYDPTKTPILEKAPLQLSDEVESIKMQASFDYRGKLDLFYYSFSFFPDKKIDRKKYIDIFNAILGKPIKISDQYAFVIEYEGYTVSILTFKNEIRLLPVLPNIPIEKPSK